MVLSYVAATLLLKAVPWLISWTSFERWEEEWVEMLALGGLCYLPFQVPMREWSNSQKTTPCFLCSLLYAVSLHVRSHMHTQRAWWKQPLSLPSKIYLDPQYCLHSKGQVFDISTHPFPVCGIKDFIVTMFNMQFIICMLTANEQVVLKSGFGVIVGGLFHDFVCVRAERKHLLQNGLDQVMQRHDCHSSGCFESAEL